MRTSRIELVSWVVAIALILATILFVVDRLNLYATPPQLPDTANLVDRLLGSIGYRHAIWPIFAGTNLLFGVGFVGIVAFAALLPASRDGQRPLGPAVLAASGILAAVGALVLVGAVDVTISTPYCDCGFKEQEVVSQAWALMLIDGVHTWLTRGALLLSGIALLALVPELGLRGTLRLLTQLTAVLLIVEPIVEFLDIDVVPDVLSAAIAAVLVPIWGIWTARLVSRGSTA